jgi:hypothetical protein
MCLQLYQIIQMHDDVLFYDDIMTDLPFTNVSSRTTVRLQVTELACEEAVVQVRHMTYDIIPCCTHISNYTLGFYICK